MTDVNTSEVLTQEPSARALKVFINYRHEDMPFAALTLYRELKSGFGAENIFFDGGTLRPGMDFLEEITSHLGDPPGAFIAVIGSKWTDTLTAHQQVGDKDYVVQEIELGLQNGWVFIPLLLNDAHLPAASLLPPSIRALRSRQVARLRMDSLDDDVESLTALLHGINVHPPIVAGGGGTDQDVSQREPLMPTDSSIRVLPPEEQPVPPEERSVPPEALSVDDEHYQTLIDEADNLAIFLGARANMDDRSLPPAAAALLDDTGLAEFLALKARMKSGERELAEVAQYARMFRGEPRVLSWVKQALSSNPEPGPVHMYLARLPKRLEELELQKRYQMIVTPKLDVALEKALRRVGQPFDVAIYIAPGTEHPHAGKFVHIPWDKAEPQVIVAPNEYRGFPISAGSCELTRTVVVRTNGAVDDDDAGYPWPNNYVITEDHYIDYTGGRAPEEVVPTQILAKLHQASCLFLGYAIADWRLRVFLHWIWPGEKPNAAMRWAVDSNPSMIDRQTWTDTKVGLYQCRLTDYVLGLDRYLAEHRDELQ